MRWQAALGWVLAVAMPVMAGAQERGYWHAESSTAMGVTGDVTLSERKIFLGMVGFTIAEIRTLTPAEMGAVFSGESTTAGASGHLYRLSIAAEKRFLHKNTMCGGDETQWMVTLAQGKSLQLAFFSGTAMPVLTAEAVATTTSLCGTYGYSR